MPANFKDQFHPFWWSLWELVMLLIKQMLESEESDSFCPVQTDLSIWVVKSNNLRESLFLVGSS